jgi:hypothetical protein
MLKWLVPWHRFTVDSPLPPRAALERLAREVGSGGNWFGFGGDGKPFRGNVERDGFQVTRVIGYRNSFLPVVSGTVEPRGSGSRVRVEMRLHGFVMAFLPLFLLLFTSSFAARGQQFVQESALEVAGIVGFVAAIMLGGFWFEATRQERMLRAIFVGVGEA